MRAHFTLPILIAASVALGGCVTMPMAPTVAVMPAPGQPLNEFRSDDYNCRQYARQQLGADPNETAGNQVAAGAVIGTVAGAAVGALLGHGRGWATRQGAATGLVMGTAVGAGNAQNTQYNAQGRYNVAYAQCMYSRGAQVPGYGRPAYGPPRGYDNRGSYYDRPPPPDSQPDQY